MVGIMLSQKRFLAFLIGRISMVLIEVSISSADMEEKAENRRQLIYSCVYKQYATVDVHKFQRLLPLGYDFPVIPSSSPVRIKESGHQTVKGRAVSQRAIWWIAMYLSLG